MRIKIITLYILSSIHLFSFQEVELFDSIRQNKIQTKIEFLFAEKKLLKEVDENNQNFKNLSELSQSIILYYKEFLIANREEDQNLPQTRKLLLDSDLKDITLLKMPLDRRVLYSDYMEDSTPKFLFELDKNLYSLYLYSNSHNVLTQAVCFKIKNGKPYLTVANEEKYIKKRSEISDILESYQKFELLNYNTIYKSIFKSESKLAIYLLFIIPLFIFIFWRILSKKIIR